ncbi:MAG: hypothetical protein KatS3mg042_1177 [Rhodothermaceae bacterium]|nr:MAG: hypothetical protein KatS3mg042_1177 [Rhodothermaceae bacterium]
MLRTTIRGRYATGLLLLGLFLALPAAGQTLFPGVTGQALRDSLVLHYKTSVTLSYNQARDTLFARIEGGWTDSLRCVYTGYALHLDPAEDPTKAACNGDGDNNASTCNGNLNINTEHAWPQSYGAGSGHARQDMHHLFPARADVNSTRGNHPFAEIDAADIDRWYRHTSTLTAPPAAPETYARFDADADVFMPRDERKGDIARALFYFYTMYQAEADAAVDGSGLTGTEFFEMQKLTLLAWHQADPPDEAERARSQAIAAYQDGKENPYVIDPTLVERAFFSDPLPVLLTRFDAVADGQDVRLRWETPPGTLPGVFFVEHRADEQPAGWRTIGVAGAREGATGVYAFTVSDLAPGTHRFRLRQIGPDGTAVYGPERSVHLDVPGALLVAAPYPNPFREATHLTLTSRHTRHVRIHVYDALGRRVARLYDGLLEAGIPRTVRFDDPSLPAGLYLLEVLGDDLRETRLVTRLR